MNLFISLTKTLALLIFLEIMIISVEASQGKDHSQPITLQAESSTEFTLIPINSLEDPLDRQEFSQPEPLPLPNIAPQMLDPNELPRNSTDATEIKNADLPDITSAEQHLPQQEGATELFLPEDTNFLSTCKIKEFGVQFMCNPEWEIADSRHPDESPVIISQDPLITLTWKKFPIKIRYLGQVNQLFLEDSANYASGFKTEQVEFAGYPAVAVKGYDQNFPETQRQDYYYIYDQHLIGISFAITPAQRWEEKKRWLKEIKESFAGLPH